MSKLIIALSIVLLVVVASGSAVRAEHHGLTLAVVMTNDPVSNQIKVYDAKTKVLLQTLSTQGKGGVAGNARGVKQHNGELVAAVNNGSNTVALYHRHGDRLKFAGLVTTTTWFSAAAIDGRDGAATKIAQLNNPGQDIGALLL